MAISKVWIEEGCISCNACVDIAPDVLEMNDEDICVVKEGADLAANEDAIKEAAEACPVEAIKYE